jgi:hypothetical protein
MSESLKALAEIQKFITPFLGLQEGTCSAVTVGQVARKIQTRIQTISKELRGQPTDPAPNAELEEVDDLSGVQPLRPATKPGQSATALRRPTPPPPTPTRINPAAAQAKPAKVTSLGIDQADALDDGTDDIQASLSLILRRLKKLEEIEASVKDTKGSLDSLTARMNTQERSLSMMEKVFYNQPAKPADKPAATSPAPAPAQNGTVDELFESKS